VWTAERKSETAKTLEIGLRTAQQYSGVQRKQYSRVHRRQHIGAQEGSTVEYKKAILQEDSTAVYREEYSGECTAQFGEIKVNLMSQ